jgi:hypothetical protein
MMAMKYGKRSLAERESIAHNDIAVPARVCHLKPNDESL